LSTDARHSEFSEWHLSTDGGHSEFSERHLLTDGGHSELSERHLSTEERQSEFSERYLSAEGKHSEFSERHYFARKVAIGILIKHHTVAGNLWIAELLGMRHDQTVSRLIQQEKDAFQQQCKQRKKMFP
jgi:hypothetical protein